jgi:DNA helicase II / ATP-dependent DNA helicase PcrA
MNPFVIEAINESLPEAEGRISGSPQQKAFWDELIHGDGNVLLEARAGTGKSSSCREGMWRLLEESQTRPRIRYCCFNKAIAREFEERCPEGVEVGTMHKFGLAACSKAFQSRIDEKKTYAVLDLMEGGKDLPRYLRKAIHSLVTLAKNHAVDPRGVLDNDLERIKVVSKRIFDLLTHYDVEVWGKPAEVVAWATRALASSAEHTTIVDFDDMLWLPVLYKLSFPTLDFLFVDECQDLNPVQHALVPLMNPSGRTIITGDPYQSVYAFRGADSDSITNLTAQLNAKTLPLTVTWRCPRSHVELARRYVSDFEAAPEAPEGEVIHGWESAVDSARTGDLVLCRANAPLVKGCLQLIKQRRKAFVRGRALGDQLNAIVRKVGGATMDAFLDGLDAWLAREIARLERKEGTEHLIEAAHDKADCIDAIADSCERPDEVPRAVDFLFAESDGAGDRVTFSTVHRAKGSEAERVHLIDIPFSEFRDKIRPPADWELAQRRNLKYVALTRSKSHLSLLSPQP